MIPLELMTDPPRNEHGERLCLGGCGRLPRIDGRHQYCWACAGQRFGCVFCGSLDLASGYTRRMGHRRCNRQACIYREDADYYRCLARIMHKLHQQGMSKIGARVARSLNSRLRTSLAATVGTSLTASMGCNEATDHLLARAHVYEFLASIEDQKANTNPDTPPRRVVRMVAGR